MYSFDNPTTLENRNIIYSLINGFITWWSSSATERDEVSDSNISSSLLNSQQDESKVIEDEPCKRNDSASEIPSYVECPITLQIYRHPVMLVEAQMVIEEDVVESLTVCPGGPNIGVKLRSKTYFPDIGTQKAVEAYLKRHPEKDNAEERYHDYLSSFSGKKAVASAYDKNYKSDICYREFGCSNKFGGVLLFTFIGGFAVGLYYAIRSIPCRNLALKNLTGEPLSFTYPETVDDDMVHGCSIHPWQNVSSDSSIYLNRRNLLTCTFYFNNGIKLHTSASKVSTSGEDSNGCTIETEKASSKCSWNLFKDCSNSMQEIVEAEEASYHLRRG
jgi:hypothetical protein